MLGKNNLILKKNAFLFLTFPKRGSTKLFLILEKSEARVLKKLFLKKKSVSKIG